jgi:lipopolysaccharide/colanic/teichoic acid biosynthesis glycosyltransferase
MKLKHLIASPKFYDISDLSPEILKSIKLPETYLKFRRFLEFMFILLFLPIFFLFFIVVIIILKFYQGGDIFYIPDRPGLNDSVFKMYKFRTMVKSTAKYYKHEEDKISPFCKFIRRHRIDELPQVINILKGDMSFIGPRPEDIRYYNDCKETIPIYKYKYMIRPGITGWAQVFYKHTDSFDDAYTKFGYEYFYLKNLSWKLDLIILVKTFSVIFKGSGAR